MIPFFFFYERFFNCKKYKKIQNKTKEVHVSSIAMEANKTALFFNLKRTKQQHLTNN